MTLKYELRSFAASAITIALAVFATTPLAQGPAPGKGPGKGSSFNKDNTRGWSMMTREERDEHRNTMLSMKTYGECVAYREEHRKLVEGRAKERGRAMPAAPRQDMCERMKQAGRFSG